MKLLQIAALALCLTVPVTHANDDASSCTTKVTLLTICATLTSAAAKKVYDDYHELSTPERIAKPIAVAALAVFTGVTAGFAYYDCTNSNCTSNQ